MGGQEPCRGPLGEKSAFEFPILGPEAGELLGRHGNERGVQPHQPRGAVAVRTWTCTPFQTRKLAIPHRGLIGFVAPASAIGSKWCAKSMAFFEDRVDCRGAAQWLGLLVVKCDDATDTVGAMPQDQNSACIRNATTFTGPRSLLYAGWTMRCRSNPTVKYGAR